MTRGLGNFLISAFDIRNKIMTRTVAINFELITGIKPISTNSGNPTQVIKFEPRYKNITPKPETDGLASEDLYILLEGKKEVEVGKYHANIELGHYHENGCFYIYKRGSPYGTICVDTVIGWAYKDRS